MADLLSLSDKIRKYLNPQSNGGKNFWSSPVARGLGNVQRAIESPRITNPIPTFTPFKGRALPSQIGNSVANIPGGILNSIVGKGVIAPSLDIGTNLGRVATKQSPLAYDQARSGATRLGYQLGGLYQPANNVDRLKQTFGNLADAALPIANAYVPKVGGAALKGLGKAPSLAGRALEGIKEGAKLGSGFGLLSGLSENRDNKNNLNYVLKVVGSSLGGGVTGAGLGGLTSVGAGLIKDLTVRPEIVNTQLRDAAGRWTKGKTPVKPPKMTKPQWEFQLEFNKRFGRNPYEPVYPSDLAQAAKIGIERKIGNQVRDIHKDVIPGRFSERGFTASVKESPNVVEPVKTNIQGAYAPKPNTKLMGEAQALLQEGANIDLKRVQGADKKVAATIQEAINAQKAGDHQAAANLFNNLSEQGTELGRGVQAFSLLEKMSPEAVSLSVAGKIKKYNQTALRKIPELTGEQQKIISDQITALDLLKGREKNIALNELQNTINSFIPSSAVDKGIAVWKAGLLTSLRTHERNFIGNAIHGTLEVAKDLPGAVADIGMSAATGKRSMAFTIKGGKDLASKGTRQQMADIISKGYDPSEMVTKFDYKKINWGNNPVERTLKKYTDTVFNTLGASDKPFYNSALSRSLYDQAATEAINAGRRGDKAFIEGLVKNPTEVMMKTAIGDANVATFKNKNAASSVASAIKNALSSDKLGPIGSEVGKLVSEITMPFTGVPSSILGQTINYSPVGLLKGIANVGRVSLTNMPELQRQAAQEVGRGVIGTGIYALGAYLMSKGLITGQPKDAEEQRLWDAENKPRNSIFLGGKWRSLNSIGPEAVVFLAGSKLQQEMDNPDGSAADYALSLGKDYLDQSFVQGLKAPINALTDPKRYAKSYAGQTLSSFIPNIVKDAGKANDPYMREANTVGDYFKSNIPGVRNSMIPARDVLGNIRPQEPTGVGAFVDIFNSKTPVDNQVVGELDRLYKSGNGATPGKLGKSQTIKGVKQTLTPEQLDSLEAQVGPAATKQLQALFNSSGYQKLGDEEKANAVQSVLSAVRKKVRAGADVSSAAPDQTSTVSAGKQYILVNPETGNVKQIDLGKTIEKPSLTGVQSIDKKLLSSFRSEITSQMTNIVDLYKDGQLTLQEASAAMDKLESQYKKAQGSKKPKKIAIKRITVKPAKFARSKLRTYRPSKSPNIKIKSPKLAHIKLSKAKIAKVKIQKQGKGLAKFA